MCVFVCGLFDDTHEDKVYEYMFRSVLRQIPIKTIICVASLRCTFKMYKASNLQQLQENGDCERQIDVAELILKIGLLIYWRMWGDQDIEMHEHDGHLAIW